MLLKFSKKCSGEIEDNFRSIAEEMQRLWKAVVSNSQSSVIGKIREKKRQAITEGKTPKFVIVDCFVYKDLQREWWNIIGRNDIEPARIEGLIVCHMNQSIDGYIHVV